VAKLVFAASFLQRQSRSGEPQIGTDQTQMPKYLCFICVSSVASSLAGDLEPLGVGRRRRRLGARAARLLAADLFRVLLPRLHRQTVAVLAMPSAAVPVRRLLPEAVSMPTLPGDILPVRRLLQKANRLLATHPAAPLVQMRSAGELFVSQWEVVDVDVGYASA